MIGTQIGSYRVTSQIGEGGMGQVYLAEHTLIGRQAAIKVLLPQLSHREEIVNRFFNEAKAATAIKHPGIVEVYDFGYHTDGSAYIVMEHLDGESLHARRLRTGTLPIVTAVDVIAQMANALAAAHAQGIVHRDLKPENVFLVLDPVSGSERTKILDFGIAKLVTNEGPNSQTGTGVVMGTPSYMAPEQCRGAGKVDHRADIYSLGCIFFELVCGRPPFVAEGAGEVLAAHLHLAAPRALDHAPGLPAEVDAIITRLLAKNPAQRYQSARELLDVLRVVLGGPVAARAASDPTLHISQSAPASSPPGTLLAPGSVPPATPGSYPPATPGSYPPGAQTAAADSQPPLGARLVTPGLHPPTMPLPEMESAGATGEERVTTLGAASGAVDTASRRGSGGIVAAFVVVAALIGGGIFAFTRGSGDDDGASESAASESAAAVEPTPQPAPPPPPIATPDGGAAPVIASPEKPNITIELESEPPGAVVYQQPDAIRLGRAPFTITRPAAEGELELVLVLEGYRRRNILVPADRNSVRVVRLERKRSGRKQSGKRSSGPEPKADASGGSDPDKTGSGKDSEDRTVDPFSQ